MRFTISRRQFRVKDKPKGRWQHERNSGHPVADPLYRLTKNVFSLQSHATRVRFQEFGLLLLRTLNILKEPLNELSSILEQLAIE